LGVGTLISLEEYLRTGYDPDCDFIDGEVLERNVGLKTHGLAQLKVASWFDVGEPVLQPLIALRIQVGPSRVRIPDVVVCELPLPDEDVFTTPPYLCVEVMSPDDTMFAIQERLDDYLHFGVPNIWVVDPWKHRGWRITPEGWTLASDGIMRTADGRVAMPLADVLLP
jgi:Uma2 family endonuclease